MPNGGGQDVGGVWSLYAVGERAVKTGSVCGKRGRVLTPGRDARGSDVVLRAAGGVRVELVVRPRGHISVGVVVGPGNHAAELICACGQ